MITLSNNKKNFFDMVTHFIEYGRISHAYLIEVGNYDLDMKYVYSFIKMLLCKNDHYNLDSNSCFSCPVCNLIDQSNYPDLRVIEPSGAWIKKEQLLSLQEDFKNKSFFDNKRIYVIKEADKLNLSSANTILKFLEEPEDDIVAILLTTNRYRVLDTILSRCQILSLKDDENITEIAPSSLQLLKFIVGKDDLFIHYNEILEDILPDKNKDIVKFRLQEIASAIISYLHFFSDKQRVKCLPEIVSILSSCNSTYIIHIVAVIEDSLEKLDYNVNYKLWLDSFFARLIGG